MNTDAILSAAVNDLGSGFATHEVMNQSGALENYSAFAADQPLVAAMRALKS